MKATVVRSLLVIASLAGTSIAWASPEVNTTQGAVLVDGKPAPGVALHGYDPVAYFTVGKPTLGKAEFSTVYNQATYRFSSKKNLEMFKATPAKYAPQFGGYCAFGVSVGAKFDGDPLLWKIVDGKLYVNLDENIAAAFNKDVAGALVKANANWPEVKSK